MDTGATPDLINQSCWKTFAELGATGSMVRMFLLCDRQFIGQRFRCEKVQAVMLAGKNVIEFYDQAGELLKTVSLEETEKKAAA